MLSKDQKAKKDFSNFNLVVRMAISKVCLLPILSERRPKTRLPRARPSMKQEDIICTQI